MGKFLAWNDNVVDGIGHARTLSAGQEIVINTLFYDVAILLGGVDQKDQILPLTVFRYRVRITNGVYGRCLQAV